MTEASTLKDIQRSNIGVEINLFQLNVSSLLADNEVCPVAPSEDGQCIFYFTPMIDSGSKIRTEGSASNISFGGQSYEPIPMDISGFISQSTGSLPRPRITISNVNAIFSPLLLTFENLLGANITRIRTFAKHLDGGQDPNVKAILDLHEYRINRKTGHTKRHIEFELISPIEQEGAKLPKQQILRSCSHTYRIFKDSLVDFKQGSCPYIDEALFTKLGIPTVDPKLDQCGKRASDCAIRFETTGTNVPLPLRSFPNVRR